MKVKDSQPQQLNDFFLKVLYNLKYIFTTNTIIYPMFVFF